MRFAVSLLLFLVCWQHICRGQELYPNAEPASDVPLHVMGVRLFSQSYNEVNRVRNLLGVKLMYGLLPRLSVEATPNISNHHSKLLPAEFPTHNTPQIGVTLPYRFNGVDFYAKYRFLSVDAQNRHLRAAGYGEYSFLRVAHDEAEPSLLDDNSGVGAGVILTYLTGHFAASFTGGIILPFKYKGEVPDVIPSLPGLPATVTYGNAYNYSLSLGYLLYPTAYSSYKQTNWNIYLEFLGKTYDAMKMEVGNVYSSSLPQYAISTRGNRALQGGNYIELYPGIQAIIRSDIRIDFSVGFPLLNRSFVHFYPVYSLGVQRYLFFNRK